MTSEFLGSQLTSSRYRIPTAESFRRAIEEDDFDIKMAKTEEDKQFSANARASKLWRTLRIASKSRLNLFDKIDDGNNLQALFEPADETESIRDENCKETAGVKSDTPLASSSEFSSLTATTPPERGARTEVTG